MKNRDGFTVFTHYIIYTCSLLAHLRNDYIDIEESDSVAVTIILNFKKLSMEMQRMCKEMSPKVNRRATRPQTRQKAEKGA